MRMETCVWWVDQQEDLVVSKSVGTTSGVRCAIKTGPGQTPSLRADSLVGSPDVS